MMDDRLIFSRPPSLGSDAFRTRLTETLAQWPADLARSAFFDRETRAHVSASKQPDAVVNSVRARIKASTHAQLVHVQEVNAPVPVLLMQVPVGVPAQARLSVA